MDNYTVAKQSQTYLLSNLSRASEELRDVPGVGAGLMGLTPDSVKATEAYKIAKKRYNIAFSDLREFNKVFVKTFRKEIRED